MNTPVALQPYQVRVIEERKELCARICKLKDFLNETPFPVGSDEGDAREERALLHYQRIAMDEYLSILDKRIKLWVNGHAVPLDPVPLTPVHIR